jgi:hypothetical protein
VIYFYIEMSRREPRSERKTLSLGDLPLSPGVPVSFRQLGPVACVRFVNDRVS